MESDGKIKFIKSLEIKFGIWTSYDKATVNFYDSANYYLFKFYGKTNKAYLSRFTTPLDKEYNFVLIAPKKSEEVAQKREDKYIKMLQLAVANLGKQKILELINKIEER